MKLSDLHEFSPVRPDDAWGTMSEGVKIACQAPGFNPGLWFDLSSFSFYSTKLGISKIANIQTTKETIYG